MQRRCFIALVASLGFFHIVCSGSGNTSENSLSDNNNSAKLPSESSSNTTILNNMLAREILQRQALENKVAALGRQITALIGDVANGQRACSVLKRDVRGISLRQNNMASSLQTITQRVDSENVNMEASLRNLSNITSKLLTSEHSIAFLARISDRSPLQTETALKFDSTEFNFGRAYDATSGTFEAPLAGFYNFQTTVHVLSGSFEGYLSKNGVPEVYLSLKGFPYQVSDSVSLTLSLNGGDRIWVGRTNQGRSDTAPRKSLFSGYLIKAI